MAEKYADNELDRIRIVKGRLTRAEEAARDVRKQNIEDPEEKKDVDTDGCILQLDEMVCGMCMLWDRARKWLEGGTCMQMMPILCGGALSLILFVIELSMCIMVNQNIHLCLSGMAKADVVHRELESALMATRPVMTTAPITPAATPTPLAGGNNTLAQGGTPSPTATVASAAQTASVVSVWDNVTNTVLQCAAIDVEGCGYRLSDTSRVSVQAHLNVRIMLMVIGLVPMVWTAIQRCRTLDNELQKIVNPRIREEKTLYEASMEIAESLDYGHATWTAVLAFITHGILGILGWVMDAMMLHAYTDTTAAACGALNEKILRLYTTYFAPSLPLTVSVCMAVNIIATLWGFSFCGEQFCLVYGKCSVFIPVKQVPLRAPTDEEIARRLATSTNAVIRTGQRQWDRNDSDTVRGDTDTVTSAWETVDPQWDQFSGHRPRIQIIGE